MRDRAGQGAGQQALPHLHLHLMGPRPVVRHNLPPVSLDRSGQSTLLKGEALAIQ